MFLEKVKTDAATWLEIIFFENHMVIAAINSVHPNRIKNKCSLICIKPPTKAKGILKAIIGITFFQSYSFCLWK